MRERHAVRLKQALRMASGVGRPRTSVNWILLQLLLKPAHIAPIAGVVLGAVPSSRKMLSEMAALANYLYCVRRGAWTIDTYIIYYGISVG